MTVIALDVGDKRIGVARGDTMVRVPVAHTTLEVDNTIMNQLRELIDEVKPQLIVVGLPRNQQGATTTQTAKVKKFTKQLEQWGIEIVFQDESLTSVLAEKHLAAHGKPYAKADVDAHAAALILGDYLESHNVV
jgi:putative Holliday junction resolvase